MESFKEQLIDRSDFAAPRRILVATDLTDGEYLIPHAVAQAKSSNAIVTLVHAILPSESIPVDAGFYAYADIARVEQEIHFILREIAAQIEAQGVPCNVIAKHGLAPEIILEQIRATGAERLLMASHGRGKFRQLVLGSVTANLLSSVNIPVFVVGPCSVRCKRHTSPRRILHPVSLPPGLGIGGQLRSIDLAIDLARMYKAELTLLHIPDHDAEKEIHSGCTLTWAENLASTVLREEESCDTPINIKVAFGNRVEEIRSAASEIHADWIVLGVDEGYPFWPLAESTAYKVLAVADCPVLALRHQTRRTTKKKVEEPQYMTVNG